jgi:hypothetical protein
MPDLRHPKGPAHSWPTKGGGHRCIPFQYHPRLLRNLWTLERVHPIKYIFKIIPGLHALNAIFGHWNCATFINPITRPQCHIWPLELCKHLYIPITRPQCLIWPLELCKYLYNTFVESHDLYLIISCHKFRNHCFI